MGDDDDGEILIVPHCSSNILSTLHAPAAGCIAF